MVTIDGTTISGATIDGDPVQEITIDGNVAWKNILYEEGFEDGTIGSFTDKSQSGSAYLTASNNTSYSGTYSLRAHSDSGGSSSVYFQSADIVTNGMMGEFSNFIRHTQQDDNDCNGMIGFYSNIDDRRIYYRFKNTDTRLLVQDADGTNQFDTSVPGILNDGWQEFSAKFDGTTITELTAGHDTYTDISTNTDWTDGDYYWYSRVNMWDNMGSGDMQAYFDDFMVK